QRYGLLRTTSVAGPVFTFQPSGTYALSAGTSFTLSATVAGGNGVAYQWRKNNVAIANATAPTLTLSSVQAADAGSYAVAVLHSGGTLVSTAATVSVTATAPVLNS